MYLSRLVVYNFRSLEEVTIGFRTGMNVLVGKNNAGKSNIIEALNALLGEKWPTYLEFENKQFYRADTSSEPAEKFLIAVRLAGSSYNRDLIIQQNIKACYREITDFPRWSDFETIEDLCDGKGNWPIGEDLALLLDRASSLWFFLIVPRDERRKNRVFGALLAEQVPNTNKIRLALLQRFPQEFRESLLTTSRIPAFRDPAKELRINNFSWYGKLIKSLYDAKTQEQSDQIQHTQEKLSQIYCDVFKDATVELCSSLSEAIFHHNISFEPAPFTLDESHKNVTIFIDDGISSPYYEKGSGIQSALIIALFGYYCGQFHQGGSLLLAEEPELFLHPHARRAVEGQLLRFAQSGDHARSRQVILSTHATEFIRNIDAGALILVQKPPTETCTTVRQVSASVLDADAKKRWRQIVTTKNAEVFFGDHAILVEGGEEYVLGPLADLLFGTPRWLDTKNVTIARVDGKMQFATYSAILSSYGIEHTILTDLDFLRRGVSPFADKLEKENRRALDSLHVKLNALMTKPRAKDIKAAVVEPSLDWTSFYDQFDEFITELQLGNDVDEHKLGNAATLWDLVKQRINRSKLQDAAKDDTELAQIMMEVILAFSKKGIFILPKGEFEHYLSDDARLLQQGDPSKDRRAAIIGDVLRNCSNIDEAAQWIDAAEFIKLLRHVETKVAERPMQNP